MKLKSDTSDGQKQHNETDMDERLLKQLTDPLAKANLAAEHALDAGLEAIAQVSILTEFGISVVYFRAP